MARASGLGKGLSALIGEKRANISEIAENSGKKDRIAVSEIHPGPFQPRTIFDDQEMEELAESIRRNGVLQPILVKKRNLGSGFVIIAGERRWRASKQAGLNDIPCIILDVDDKQAMEIALIENIQRQNLKVLEEADGYRKLIKEFDYTQEQLADVIGKSRSHVTNILRLTALPDEVKAYLNAGTITTGHARAILSAPDVIMAVNEVIEKNLSVRQTENLVRRLSAAENGGVIRRKYTRKKKNDITDLDITPEELVVGDEQVEEEVNPLEFETHLDKFEHGFSPKEEGQHYDFNSSTEFIADIQESNEDKTEFTQPASVKRHRKKEKDEEVLLLEQEFTRIFGYKVEINDFDNDGELVIKYKNMEELNEILNKLEGK